MNIRVCNALTTNTAAPRGVTIRRSDGMCSVPNVFLLQGGHQLRPASPKLNIVTTVGCRECRAKVEWTKNYQVQYNDSWSQVVCLTLVKLVLSTTAAVRTLKLVRAHIDALIHRSTRLKETRRVTKDIKADRNTGRRIEHVFRKKDGRSPVLYPYIYTGTCGTRIARNTRTCISALRLVEPNKGFAADIARSLKLYISASLMPRRARVGVARYGRFPPV